MRAALVLLVASFLGGCAQPPTVRIVVRRLVGPRPAQAVVRCVTDGLKAPVELRWKLAPGVRVVGGNVPLHEAALLVQLSEPVPAGGAWVECTATGSDGRAAKATASLVRPRIGALMPSRTQAGALHELVTVRGNGFAPIRGNNDALYFVAGAAAVAADHGCAGAAWSDEAVSACVPASLPPGTWQVRLQVGEALALAPISLAVTRGP
jgi:hypothetical protein